jgi:hypothetical protein
MTEAERIIEECERLGVALSVGESSDALAFDAPPGAMTPALREQIVAHKADVIQTLFEREERAAIQAAPEWVDASTWHRGTAHPATLALLEKLAALGPSIISVTPTRRAESEAA